MSDYYMSLLGSVIEHNFKVNCSCKAKVFISLNRFCLLSPKWCITLLMTDRPDIDVLASSVIMFAIKLVRIIILREDISHMHVWIQWRGSRNSNNYLFISDLKSWKTMCTLYNKHANVLPWIVYREFTSLKQLTARTEETAIFIPAL